MSKLGKLLLFLIVAALASAGAYAYVRNGKKGEGAFKEVEVTRGTIVEKAVAVGQIQPRQKFQVKSKISGIVRRALVQVGDTVKAGDPLFEIAPDSDAARSHRSRSPRRIRRSIVPARRERIQPRQRALEQRRPAEVRSRRKERSVRARQRRAQQGAAGSRPHAQAAASPPAPARNRSSARRPPAPC